MKCYVIYQDPCKCSLSEATAFVLASDCKDWLSRLRPMDFALFFAGFAFILRVIELLIW